MFKARVQFWRRIDRLIGFESDNEIAAKFSRERIKSVRNTIHIYYLTIIAPFIGIAWVTWEQTPTRIMAGILVLAVITRFRHWVLPLPEGASEDVNPVAARVTGFMVVLLSCSQTLFYLSLAFGSIAFNNENMAWLQILSLALLAGLTQGAALTGIVFASRVIFFCFVLPLVAAVLYIYAGNNLPASVAVIVLTVVSLYLAETSHKMQLSLFKAQFDADAALVGMERTNLELVDARRTAQRQAEFDNLTGVRNRLAFIHDVEAKLDGGQCGLLAVIDLDRFKEINDSLGHDMGDRLLIEVARRLRAGTRSTDMVARFGGDEFAMLLTLRDTDDALDVERRLHVLHQSICEKVNLEGITFEIGASVGVAGWPDHGFDSAMILRHADTAMYEAKRQQSGVVWYEPELDADAPRRLDLYLSARSALEGHDLYVNYQPKISATTGQITGAEALARWKH